MLFWAIFGGFVAFAVLGSWGLISWVDRATKRNAGLETREVESDGFGWYVFALVGFAVLLVALLSQGRSRTSDMGIEPPSGQTTGIDRY